MNLKNLSRFFGTLQTLETAVVRSVRIIPGRRDLGGGVGVRAPEGAPGGGVLINALTDGSAPPAYESPACAVFIVPAPQR